MPVIVAESLERVSFPLETLLRPVGKASAADVVGQIAARLARPIDPRPMPEWLRPEQRAQCARLLPVLNQYGGALLADPVGSGKTWIALAVASLWPTAGLRHPTALVPASLIAQWKRAAERAGVAIAICSHEKTSRGSVPVSLTVDPVSSLVIVDESHHFRNPETRRYHTIAPHLAGKAVLLLTATPVVNGLQDLAAQLALGIRDDALAPFGIPSLQKYFSISSPPSAALGELILTRRPVTEAQPSRALRKSKDLDDDAGMEARCLLLERLALSSNPATAALIRTVIWRALASSDLALLAVLRRYQSLLLHARDAGATGQRLSRASLRLLLAADDQQLVLWQLLPSEVSPDDLVLDDLSLLERLINDARRRARQRDAKCARLANLLESGESTVVFAGARETVRYLRDQLPNSAWCTGESAGIGITRLDREDVLSWFRPTAGPGGPTVLLTTDVAAEGLDLQRAGRIIHYDLPWTAVRLDQRDGRALRLGSRHFRVEVVRFDLPVPIERRLGQLHLLARKRRLPRLAGIDQSGTRHWTWRDEIAQRYPAPPGSVPGRYCTVSSPEEGVLAGLSFSRCADSGKSRRVATVVGVLSAAGEWSEDSALVGRWMEAAAEGPPIHLDEKTIQRHISRIAAIASERLRVLEQAKWSRLVTPLQTRIIARLNRLVARAARARDARRLGELERAIAFASRGHTAGEEMTLLKLAELPDLELFREIRQSPESPVETGPVFCQLLGMVIFAARDPDYPSPNASADDAPVRP